VKTIGELANQVGIRTSELESVAAAESEMYFFKRIKKGKKIRVLRCPKAPLARIQRAINTKILSRLPLPRTMHGWRKGGSPRSYAIVHVGHEVEINCDIENFFPSVSAGRVFGFWQSIGYDRETAVLLTRLTTRDNQLPLGTPTSPGLGNQVLRNLNHRVSRLSRLHGLSYGNYADEIALSGRARAVRLRGLVLRIIEQEGFTVNPEKIKVRYRHERQELAGIVINRRLSLGRDHYMSLRAIVHNCVKHGPDGQNRAEVPRFREHLRGKVAYLCHVNPRLGKKLLREFEKIQWP